MKRVSDVQAKKSVRKANPDRQYGNKDGDALAHFATCSGKLMDLLAQYIEDEMKVEPKGGAGCRVQRKDVSDAYGRMYVAIREFMDNEKKGEEDE